MKKIFFIGLFLITALSYKCEAQQGNDTLAILQNIISNKADYIGQPFSVLLSQLPIQIKFFMPLPGTQLRSQETVTSFSFYYPENENQLYRTFPRLRIYWQQTLNRRQSLNLYYQTNGGWSTALATYYGSATVSEIQVER